MKTQLTNAFGCPDEGLLREFCSYDIQCPECCKLEPHKALKEIHTINMDLGLCSMHWSRQYEYPWAILNSNFTGEDLCLEAGGGYATFKYGLAKRCRQVVSIDTDLDSQRKAFSSTARLGINNILYANQSIQEFKHICKFDKIYCLSVLEHIQDKTIRLRCLENMLTLLKPNGELFITFDVFLKHTNDQFYIDGAEAEKLLAFFNTSFEDSTTDQHLAVNYNGTLLSAWCLKVWDV